MPLFSTFTDYRTSSWAVSIRIEMYGNTVFPHEGIAVSALQLKLYFFFI